MDRKRSADGNFVPQSGWWGQGRHSKESTYRRTRHGDLLSKQSSTLRTFGPYRSSCRRRGDLIELVTGQKILYRAYAESRDAMGGAKDQIDCFADLRQNKQMEVLRLGWKNDILHLYGIKKCQRRNYCPTAASVDCQRQCPCIRWASENEILVNLGRQYHRRTRFCSSPKRNVVVVVGWGITSK